MNSQFNTLHAGNNQLSSNTERPWSFAANKRKAICLISVFRRMPKMYGDNLSDGNELFDKFQQITDNHTTQILSKNFGNPIDKVLNQYSNVYCALIIITALVLVFASNLFPVSGIVEYDDIIHVLSHAVRYLLYLHGNKIPVLCDDISFESKCIFNGFCFGFAKVCFTNIKIILIDL